MKGAHRRLAGVVLHVRDFGDAHRIVEALTAEEGRVSALARHARASKRRFAGVLDLFASLELELLAKPGLWTLEAATLIDARLGLRADLDLLERASACCEAVRLLVAEHQASPDALTALTSGLDALARGDVPAAVAFWPRLLRAVGLAPDLTGCVRCGGSLERIGRVDADAGGVVCARCAPGGAASEQATRVLAGAPCPDVATAVMVETLAMDWVEAQTGKVMRTRRGRR